MQASFSRCEYGAVGGARFAIVNEVMGGVKPVRLGAFEQRFIDKFSSRSKICAISITLYHSLSQLPRFAVELVAFGGIILIILPFDDG